MGKRLGLAGMIAVAGLAFGLGGCNEEYYREGGPSGGAFVAAGATFNALNAKSQREAAAWAGVAELGRAQAAREAAIAGRSNVVVNAGNGGDDGGRNGIETLQLGDQVYRGEVLNGRPHGTGKVQYPDGDFYVGEFREGKREGPGRLVGSEGVWEVTCRSDRFDGIVTFTNRNGLKYTQHWREGKLVRWEEFKGAK